MKQKVISRVINTDEIPKTYAFLDKNLKSIFDNQCFNKSNQPFAVEVRSTEIGHLFEHILLELMKINVEKIFGNATFRGETSWDWVKYGKGVFWITIYTKPEYQKYFEEAFREAVLLLDLLYTQYSTNSSRTGRQLPILEKN